MTADVQAAAPRRGVVRLAGVPRAAWDLRYFQPIIDAEGLRGNPGKVDFGNTYERRAAIRFRTPIDLPAVAAEFELDDGMTLDTPAFPGVFYDSEHEERVWLVGGARKRSDDAAEKAREEWWREWRAKPRPRTALHNPFLHPDALPALVRPIPVVVADAPDVIHLGPVMSDELPGLGAGWSVWPVEWAPVGAPLREGLLVIAPAVQAIEQARAAVANSGGTDLPVLLAIRGREPASIASALRAANAEATYPL